ncbi:MAG: uroporphyrinogen decarboxylase (URO-D), partial [Oscillospiraceae bacterium]|nr:uroporphyrinogen decarboxylase (URO-D) [Oscillospiraceae bacterium]
MTPKEIFLETLKPDGKPERMLKQYEALGMLFGDPAMVFVRGMSKPGTVIQDKWGVSILMEEGGPGPVPLTDEEHKVLKDITRWREQVHFPQIETVTQGWEAARERMLAMAREDKLSAVFMPTGIFEQCHFLMGFEDTLTNLYEHPDEMHELINAIADYRIRFAKLLIDNLHPEAIFSHDDWGTKSALFMRPEMWREFFKEPYRRFYGYIRSQGVIAIHHADSFLEPIVEDMVEIGIQCWQGVLPENDIPRLQKQLNGRMVLMGGIGAAIDRQDAGEEEIRSYVAEKLQAYCPGGHYIPSITYGAPGTVFKHVDPLITDEIEKYNSRLHLPK